MARQKKTSPLEGPIGLIALLPWWAAVALGVLSYFVLHALARPAVVVGVQPGQVAHAMTQAVWKGLAAAGQYLVPFACFVAAAISALGRYRRQQLVSSVAQGKAADVLEGMSWRR